MRIESTGSAAANVTSNSLIQANASTAASAKSTASTVTAIDPATGQPVQPHFPWLTRLSAQLESSKGAQKSSPFESAKIMGETLNKLA